MGWNAYASSSFTIAAFPVASTFAGGVTTLTPILEKSFRLHQSSCSSAQLRGAGSLSLSSGVVDVLVAFCFETSGQGPPLMLLECRAKDASTACAAHGSYK